jgi:fimbrial chaperone protein
MWKIRTLFTTLLAFTFMDPVLAGVEVGGTRLIYDAGRRESSLPLKNPEKDVAYLIQSWLDQGEDETSSAIPFIVTPPLFRLDPGQENQLRVVNTGEVPQDRESLYWLNVKSIAATHDQPNQLQISVRTRIKMIYRPISLRASAAEAYRQLTVTRTGDRLTFTNPTPHFISFFDVYLDGQVQAEPAMVAPFGTFSLKVPPNSPGRVSWRAINDYGGRTEEVCR